jgi:uncharacterized protein YhbP (UPF0306 family)
MTELDPKEFITRYLSQMQIMQLATAANAQPWICNLHFAADGKANIYWISKDNARHSADILVNPQVAIAIVVQTEKPLIGLQAEGTAEIITDTAILRSAMDLYVARHGTDRHFADSVIAGTNEHKLYAFTPKLVSLYDEAHFAGLPPQVWRVEVRK